jgi:hypothetical protein
MPRLFESGFFGRIHAQLNALWDEVKANRIAQAPGYRIQRTSGGTKLEIISDAGTTSASGLRWRGEWTAATPADGLGAYKEKDLVIRGSANPASVSVNATDTILGSGTKAGLYVARRDISPSSTEPIEPALDSLNWETFSRGSWHLLVITPATGGGAITLDSRNPAGSAIAALSALGGHDVAFREYEVCVAGVTRRAILWGSLPY